MHRVARESVGAVEVVVGSGELDAYAAPDLATELEASHGRQAVVFELSRVSFMDSTALGLIVRATRELGEAGTGVRVVLPAGPARRIFEITALDEILPVAETLESALGELGG